MSHLTTLSAADFTFVTVAYASASVIPDLWASLPAGARLIVVDNGPPDGMAAWARENGVLYVPMDTNVGFGAACNEGAKYANTDWLFFINPDVRLLENSIEQLILGIRRSPNTFGFGPVMIDESGVRSFKRRSRLSPIRLPKMSAGADLATPFLSGAALVMKRDAFEAIKGFDPDIFLYFEDDDISARFTTRFGEFILISDFELIHLGGAATAGIDGLSTFKEFHYGRSEIYVLMKHRGRVAVYWHLFFVSIRLCNVFEIMIKRHRQRRAARLQGSISYFNNK
jgi:N-acetylglucosaminyl-diphospho-decaprenol L-rhamnosyltransferase